MVRCKEPNWAIVIDLKGGFTLRSVRALILVCAFLLAAMSGSAFGADETPRQKLDAIRSALGEIDYSLKTDTLTDSDLARLRRENDPLATQIQSVISELTPRLDASHKRLNELKPKSKDTTPLIDSASGELKSEQANFDALDADLRSARATLLQADDSAARIGAARRNLFARQTFVRSASVFSPILWNSLAREAPGDLTIIVAIFSDWLHGLSQRMSWATTFEILGLVAALAVLALPVRWIAQRVIAYSTDAASPGRLRLALAAVWTTLVLAALPLAALGIVSYALDAFDISDPRLQGEANAALDGLRLIALAYAFGRGLLGPESSNWRLLPLSDRTSTLAFRLVLVASVVWAAASLFEPAAELVASLNISIAARGLAALIISLTAAGVLRRLDSFPESSARAPWAPARALGWALSLLVLACAVTGYIALSTFLINLIFRAAAVCASLYLADSIIQEGAELLLSPDSIAGRRVKGTIGLRHEALEQIIVLGQGFARLAAIAAFLAIVGPLGLPRQDLLATVRTAYFGFTIGGITISLSSLFSAIIVFALCVLATRTGQKWLGERFLPRTRLDAGVSNSIRTIFGYLGLVVAILFAGSRLGLDAQKFAFVAGGLSVGIGFGLQGIANNFVSGLILLWERGIRVGDWVVVGTDQGFVRRINARSTEIETFDRATLIVPNQTLVTGSVKNWMYSDRVARIIIAVNVDFGTDLELMRTLLISAAKSREEVLSIPAPLVLFSDFGDWALKFQLVCYVDDALTSERTRSEINFDVHRRIREAQFHVPYPYPTPR